MKFQKKDGIATPFLSGKGGFRLGVFYRHSGLSLMRITVVQCKKAVDDKIKHPTDNPTIGILLCTEIEAELSGEMKIKKPLRVVREKRLP